MQIYLINIKTLQGTHISYIVKYKLRVYNNFLDILHRIKPVKMSKILVCFLSSVGIHKVNT